MQKTSRSARKNSNYCVFDNFFHSLRYPHGKRIHKETPLFTSLIVFHV
jgi:hypothetical protein